jgi:hypothetical protein
MTGRHAALGSVVPYYAWVLLDLYSTLTRGSEHRRPKLLITLGITLKQLSSVAVLIQEAVRPVQQLYPKDMQTLATFARACNDGVLPVTCTPLTGA